MKPDYHPAGALKSFTLIAPIINARFLRELFVAADTNMDGTLQVTEARGRVQGSARGLYRGYIG